MLQKTQISLQSLYLKKIITTKKLTDKQKQIQLRFSKSNKKKSISETSSIAKFDCFLLFMTILIFAIATI